jgi:ubiquinone/menaquinone biosynthesis C-methylase UbiE
MSGDKKLFRNQMGLELASVEWLLDHHKAKEQERRQMVANFNLKPGDVVLDAACGPELWAPLLGERVMPNGQVVGVDFSPDIIEYAIKKAE